MRTKESKWSWIRKTYIVLCDKKKIIISTKLNLERRNNIVFHVWHFLIGLYCNDKKEQKKRASGIDYEHFLVLTGT